MTSSSPNTLFTREEKGVKVHWLILLTLGALTALLGVFLLFQSSTAARLLMQALGIYWLIAGLVELIGTLSDRETPGRTFRLITAGGAILAGALIVISIFVERTVAPTTTRYVAAITALLMGGLNFLIGIDRAAPSRGRSILGVLYILLGVTLLLNPAAVPGFILPLIGLLFIAAGSYAVYLAWQGRAAGKVGLGFNLPSAPAAPEVQQQTLLDQARQDVERTTQQARDSDSRPPVGQ